ncbi:MAG: protein kinase [Anaerolineales bacterium]|nr:protein kinase [Anaerolineales bacterium]
MIEDILQERYQLHSEIGSGGAGTIYRAHDLLLDRDVAVKVLSDPKLSEESGAKLLQEAQAAAKLNHPNIVAVHDAGYHDGIPFIVMELVEGVSVFKDPPQEIDEIINLAQQICAALQHAHTQGIIHRDLKPENVLIASDGIAKLMDFGLARSIASRITSEGVIVGTVFYMAPEQALGQKTDHRTDLYSLGVMLYELTTNQLPFTSDDPLQVISQHLYAPVVPPRAHNPDIPPELDELTLRLLSKNPEDRPEDAFKVQMILEAIDTATAVGAMEEISPINGLVRGHMIGRHREFSEAVEIWKEAASGVSQVLLISGEPGIGKTRFALEMRTLTEVEGGQVFTGECYAEGSAPCSPIAQILRNVFQSYTVESLNLPDSYLAEFINIAPDLQMRFHEIHGSSELDPQAQQNQMFESMVGLFTRLCERSPILMILEDAHWADSCTLQFVLHLSRRARLAGLRLIIVLTYREVELDESRALNDMLYELNRERLSTRIKLLRLSQQETGKLLATMLHEDISQELLESIYLETEGNPFFIEEVCKALVEDGKLYLEGGRWHRSEFDEMEIPQSVRVAIQGRLRRLPTETQDTLRFAAILGREFDFETLKAVSEYDEETLINAIEQAERTQLIVEVRPRSNGRSTTNTTFSFAHALIPSALQEGMSGLRRQQLHRRAAQALEQTYPGRSDELSSQIGRHYAESGNGKKAVYYLLQAGDTARSLYANQEAIDAYEQALTFLTEEGDLETSARILMKLGLLYHETLDFQKSRLAYQEGFELRQQFGRHIPIAHLSTAPHPLRFPGSEPGTIDPSLATDTLSFGVAEQLFRGLVELSPQMDIIPDLARTWEILDEGRRYIFHLHDDVSWSDGEPVTAWDVKYAWLRVLDPSHDRRGAQYLYDLKGARAFNEGKEISEDSLGIKVIDDFTLEVELEAPAGYFLHFLTLALTFPVPQHAVEEFGNEWTKVEKIVTSGPFLLKKWKKGDRMIFERNPDYQGAFNGNIQRMEFLIDRDWTSSLELYESDQLDILGGLPASEIERLKRHQPDEFITGPIPATEYLSFDTTRPPFNDPKVRHAFVHALDRERYASIYLRGHLKPASGGLVPAGLPGHCPGIALLHDSQRAKQLLSEVGYPQGEGFPIIEWYTPLTTDPQPRDQFRSDIETLLNIQISLKRFELTTLLKNLQRDRPHIISMVWIADYPDPDNFLRMCVYSNTSHNFSEDYDRIIQKARRSTNQAERFELYREAEAILVEEAAIVPLGYHMFQNFAKPWVKNYPYSSLKYWCYKDVIIEAHD